jgi:hypothetical protein
MFHFNLQYVAGDYKIESKIIRNSVYPVLQFFEKNPQYKADIEIQWTPAFASVLKINTT